MLRCYFLTIMKVTRQIVRGNSLPENPTLPTSLDTITLKIVGIENGDVYSNLGGLQF